MTGVDEPTIEQMEAELKRLGWKRIMFSVYESPNKALWRGPYKAWCVATGREMRKPS